MDPKATSDSDGDGDSDSNSNSNSNGDGDGDGDGEHDLARILATLTVSRRPGVFVYLTVPTGPLLDRLGDDAEAVIREAEGNTVVLHRDRAEALGASWAFEAAWLTVDVHTALAGVGLTAALATALTKAGISCNVLAAFHHDHLLVPADRAGDALAALTRLAMSHAPSTS